MKNIRKITAMLLLAGMLLTVGACEKQEDGPESVPTETPEAETTAQTPETEPAPRVLKVAEGGKTEFTVVRPDKANTAVTQMSAAFRVEFAKRLGGDVAIDNDYVYEKKPLDEKAPELLIGNTNRQESADLLDALQKAGTLRYGILVSENKVAVTGTTEYMTYLGLCYLMDRYFAADADGKVGMALDVGTLYISEEQPTDVPDFAQAAKEGKKLAFYLVEKVAHLRAKDIYGTMQGGGTDGTYAYYAMINSTTLKGIIYKYDLATWKLVAQSEPLDTGHSNDITYDAVRNRLVLSYCHTNDSYTGVCLINPDTLTFDSYTKTAFAQRAVEYLPETNQYFWGTNYYYTLTDADFKQIRRFDDGWPNKTTQGMCCDGKYIYDVRWESDQKGKVQHIDVHDFSGWCYGAIPVYGTTGEPENMFRLGDDFYLGENAALSVSRMKLLFDEWW